MKRVPVVMALVSGLVCPYLSGCRNNDPEPGSIRSCGSSSFAGNSLEVWVAAGLHSVRDRSKEERFEPVIEGIEVRVNGEKADLATKTSRFYGKMGWIQTVKFIVPPGSKTVDAVLQIRHMGKRFQMTVPFKSAADPNIEWHAGQAVVVPKK